MEYSLFYVWGNWDLEKGNDLLKITELFKKESGMRNLTPSPVLSNTEFLWFGISRVQAGNIRHTYMGQWMGFNEEIVCKGVGRVSGPNKASEALSAGKSESYHF